MRVRPIVYSPVPSSSPSPFIAHLPRGPRPQPFPFCLSPSHTHVQWKHDSDFDKLIKHKNWKASYKTTVFQPENYRKHKSPNYVKPRQTLILSHKISTFLSLTTLHVGITQLKLVASDNLNHTDNEIGHKRNKWSPGVWVVLGWRYQFGGSSIEEPWRHRAHFVSQGSSRSMTHFPLHNPKI